ncbi:MAG: hypothetical protein BHW56_00250 [Acetobacter sp. 46_36]|nr:MAG: hypothetical protein BHW56_00250 [Acetobacter sp. 46_36]
MENLNTKILNKGEKKMSNKTQVWVNDWIEAETNKIDVSAKEEKKENVSKVGRFIRDWIASETNLSASN